MSSRCNSLPTGTADIQSSPPPSKRNRAKRGCDLCRKRKTRCDADQAQPCGICKNAGVECQFLVEQRKRGPGTTTHYVEFLEGRLRRLEGLLQGVQPEAQIIEGVNGLKLTDYECTTYIGESAGLHLLEQSLLASNRQHRLTRNPSWVLQKLNSETATHVLLKTQVLPVQKVATSSALWREKFLIDIPYMTMELADSMIYTYFRTIHTVMPIVHKMAFLEQYYFGNPEPPDKYLVYCMCWVATHYMKNDQDWLGTGHRYTPDMILSIRKELREKSEYVLQNAYRRPKISSIQSLLLLTQFTSPNGDNDGETFQWFACGNAIRMAQELGLHLDPTDWKMPENESEQRRRLWYAVYIVDREIAARSGRPVTISDDEFKVDLPTPYELESTYQCSTREPEFRTFSPTLILDAQNAISERATTYASFLQLIPLSRILGHALKSLYHPKMEYAAGHMDYLINSIDNKLARWKASLPKKLHFDTTPKTDTDMYISGILSIYYNFVLLILHRPSISTREEAYMTVAVRALSICTSAGIAITDTVNVLESKKVPAMSLGFTSNAVFQSALIFFIDGQDDDRFIRQQGVQYLRCCSMLFKQTEQLQHTLHSYMLTSLVSKLSDNPATMLSTNNKWDIEPVDSNADDNQRLPTIPPKYNVTSDASLYYTADPRERGHLIRTITEEPSTTQATFDVSFSPADHSLQSSLAWSYWENALQGSIHQ